MNILRRQLNGFRGVFISYGLAVALVSLAIVIRLWLDRLIGAELAIYSPFFLACAVAIRFTGVGPSVVTILASAWAVHYFFLPPRHQLLPEPAHFLVTGIFIVSNLVVLGLARAMRRERDRAELNAVAANEREEARRENERRFRALFEHSPEAVFLATPSGTIETANPTACAMFGMTQEEICARGRNGLLDRSDRRYEAVLEERQRTGKAVNREVTFIRKDGSRFPGEVSSVLVPGEPPRAIVLVRDISERKRAEEALHESQERFRIAAENAQAVFGIVQGKRFVWANPYLCRMSGYTLEEIISMDFIEMVHPDFRELVADYARRRQLGQPAPTHYEFAMVTKSGETRWMDFSPGPIEYQGSPAIVGTAYDITERKRAEEVLRDREEQLRVALSAGRMGTWVWDVASGTVTSDPLHRRLWDIDSNESLIPAQVILSRIHPEDVGRVVMDPEHAAKLTGPFDVEFRVCRRDGQVRWLSGSAIPFRDAQERVIKLVGVNFDITEQKTANEALREREHQFRIMGETVDYGVWMCNKDGGAEYVSQSFLDLLNMSMDEMKQFGWTKRLVPEDVPGMMKKWLDCVRNGKLWDSEHRIIDRHGKIHTVLTRGKPVRDAHGNITSWVGINLDITERKKTEHALAEAKEQLRQYTENLEKMVEERSRKLNELVDEMEHFSYAITHDMRAPLRTMHGLSKMLLSECKECLDGERRDVLRRIADAATRMDDLITDSLNYSKVSRQQFDLEPVDVATLVEGVVESYPEFQPHKAEITIEDDIPMMWGNKAGLTQCCSNLLSNAVKFVQPGKVPQVRVWAETRGEYVRLNFQDNGIGIPQEYHQQIWDMFQMLSKGYEGTGIGLPLVRKMVHRMGGRVGVESEPGRGSCFWFELKRYIM